MILNGFCFIISGNTCIPDVTSIVLLVLSPDSRTSVTFHRIKLRLVVHTKANVSSPGQMDTSPEGDKVTASVVIICSRYMLDSSK